MTKLISELINDLKSSHWLVRSRAAEALGELGPEAEEAVSALCESLQDPHKEVRRDAVKALQKVGPKAAKATPALINALDHHEIAWEIVRILATIGGAAVEPLVALLGHDHLSHHADFALTEIGEQAVLTLANALGNKSEKVRLRVACVLSSIGPPAIDSIPKLTEVVINDDERWIVRFWALTAIENIDPSSKPVINFG